MWDHIYHKFIPASNTRCCLSSIYIGILTSALPKNFWQSLPGAVALTADVRMAENLPKAEETWVSIAVEIPLLLCLVQVVHSRPYHNIPHFPPVSDRMPAAPQWSTAQARSTFTWSINPSHFPCVFFLHSPHCPMTMLPWCTLPCITSIVRNAFPFFLKLLHFQLFLCYFSA